MVTAVSMVLDEADIIEESVRRMAGEVDALIVADNGSIDGTREILDGLARDLPLTVLDDLDQAFHQGAKMTRLARLADERGADWVIAWDCDERWFSPFGRVCEVLADRREAVVTAELHDHVATAEDPEGSPMDRIGWRRPDPLPLPKVAFRPVLRATVEQGNHGAWFPAGTAAGLCVRHFPYRSASQVVRKVRNGAAAYAASDLPEEMGAHWRAWGRILDQEGEDALASLFRKWYWRQEPRAAVEIDGEVQPPLIFDPAP